MNVLCLILNLLVPAAHAQMDPSTALLLRRPSAAPVVDVLDEEHYNVRPARRAARPAPAIIITPGAPPAAAPSVAPVTPAPRTPAAADEDAVSGDDTLMVRVAAGYLDTNSTSSNPFRDYAGGGATLGLGITLWATPTFGLKADYSSSVAAHVRDRGAGYGLDHQELDAAVMYRLDWHQTRLDLTVGYHELTNRITRATRSPLGTRTRGADVGVALSVPQTPSYAHFAELHLRPTLAHGELGVRDDATSGPTNTSYGAALAIGGQFAVERDRDWFWRARYDFEQNAFARGSTVTSGQATLILGVQWGS